jgi:hypothetical protein
MVDGQFKELDWKTFKGASIKQESFNVDKNWQVSDLEESSLPTEASIT